MAFTENDKAQVRATVFAHLAGFVVGPTVQALAASGALRVITRCPHGFEFDRLADLMHANRGYLRVALRLLVACGWLVQSAGDGGLDRYTVTEAGSAAFESAPGLYNQALSLVPTTAALEKALLDSPDESSARALEEFARKSRAGWLERTREDDDSAASAVQRQVRNHVDGLLVGPAMVVLARNGILAQMQGGSFDLTGSRSSRTVVAVFDVLETLGWLHSESGSVRLTPSGRYAAQIAHSYGVTVSYRPALACVNELLFGNARMPRVDGEGRELFVDRAMNVWGSGGAHTTYFKKIDEVIREIFNQPIETQPQGICDMGCGDGTFLAHLYGAVRDGTERGRHLDKYPLVLVGADFNEVAREATRRTLRQAGIGTHEVIYGDVNDPALLARDMRKLGWECRDFLHVRAFLDHNRPYLSCPSYVPGARISRSTGAFARLGEEIPADELEDNLVRHLQKWAPFTENFGLLILELHTLPPELTARHQDRTPAIAYDGTHGYSDQYPVELPLFLECAKEAGFVADPRYQAAFPPSELATVSINLFKTSKIKLAAPVRS